MGVVIGGVMEDIAGLSVLGFLEPQSLRLASDDYEPRDADSWIHSIVLHTTRGIPGGSDQRPQRLLSGTPPKEAHIPSIIEAWTTDRACASAHLLVDLDGTMACVADLLTETTYHAGQKEVNHHSIGIEMVQGKDAELYVEQIEQTVRLVDFLTRRFGIQRQFHWPYRNQSIHRIREGGASVVGVYGHREVSDDRGLGDPGDEIFHALRGAGYEAFDFEKGEDLRVWEERQTMLAARLSINLDTDGVPGTETVSALKLAGYSQGLFVPRLGD